MSETKTHWKQYSNPDYLGAYSLKPKEEPVYTIKQITSELVKGEGGKQCQCRVARFYEKVKPMILNATNCKTIRKMYGTPFIEEWVNKKIQIYATTTTLAGEEVECLRIRPKIPVTEKPEFSPSSPGWEKAVESVKSGEITIPKIKQKYILSQESENLLWEAIGGRPNAS